MTGSTTAGLGDLAYISAALGRDRLQVQGPGGNTSIKSDGTLWIKASGKWLAHAADEPVFVAVDLAMVRAAISSGAQDPVAGATRSGPPGLRPSIETSFHAALDHRVVLHTHSVATIALAVREDAEEALRPLLDGFDWAMAPYARPGMPLTTAIVEAMAGRSREVIVLANHGLVVCAEDCAAAAAKLADVERRLAAEARTADQGDRGELERIAAVAGYDPADDDSLHALACDPVSLRIASAGSLYPDHVVFLGSGATVVEPETPAEAVRAIVADSPPFALVRGCGVLLRRDLSAAARAMVGCLADVAARIPATAALRYLGVEDEAALTGWDAERVRQALNG